MTAPAPVADTSVYGDFAGLDALRRSARNHDPAAVRVVAKQFESLFARMLIKSMRDAVGRDPIFGSDQVDAYQSMFDDQLSLDLTRGHGLGLADMLVRQLQKMGVPGASASAQGNTKASATLTPQGRGNQPATFTQPATLAPPAMVTPSATGTRPGAAPAERQRFISAVWPQAQQAGAALGIAPAGLVAQAALETNWGRNVPQGANGQSSYNLFGIKAGASWSGPAVAASTQEVEHGSTIATAASFRAYGTAAESFQDYVALLKGNPRYAGALNQGSDIHAFAAALQRGGYATDPDYARKVSALASEVTNTVAGAAGAASPLLARAGAEPLKFASSLPIQGNAGELL